MNFDISTFLKNDGFSRKRNSDKRDAFEKTYYHPFHERDCKVEISISHNSGFTSELSWSPTRMTILFVDGPNRHGVYEGLAPNELKAAETILNHVLPSLADLKRKELPPIENDFE